MVKLSAALFSALFFFVSAVGHSQTSAPVWFTLNVQEGQTVTATRSITLRFGQVASTCAYSESTGPCSAGAGAPSPAAWTSPQTFTGSIVSVVVGAAAFGNVDPLPGVSKTVQVEEQSTPQNITVNGQPVTVPALSGSSAPVWFTLNAQEGQTVTATGSITLRFGQVASTCAYTESTGPCSCRRRRTQPSSLDLSPDLHWLNCQRSGRSRCIWQRRPSTWRVQDRAGRGAVDTPEHHRKWATGYRSGAIRFLYAGLVHSQCTGGSDGNGHRIHHSSFRPSSLHVRLHGEYRSMHCRRRRTQPRSLDFSRDFHRFDSHHSYRIGRVWQRRPAPWRTQNRAGGRTVDISKHHCKWAASECPGGLKLIHMPTVRNSRLDCLSEHHRRIHDLFFRQHFQ